MPDKPKMILFDYGQTLIDEGKFDGIKGTEAVLRYAVKNKYNLSAERVQEEADVPCDEKKDVTIVKSWQEFREQIVRPILI